MRRLAHRLQWRWLRTRVQVLLTHGNPVAFEVFAAGAAGIWAVTLLLPPVTLASSAGFRILAAVLPEDAIALLFGALAAMQATALIRDTLPGRVGAALVGWTFWSFLAATLVLGNPLAPGGYLYLWLAVGQLWTAIRLGRSRPWTPRSRY